MNPNKFTFEVENFNLHVMSLTVDIGLIRRLTQVNEGIQYNPGAWPHWRGAFSYTGYSQFKGQIPFYLLFDYRTKSEFPRIVPIYFNYVLKTYVDNHLANKLTKFVFINLS